MSFYRSCNLCPRLCGVNRTRGQRGFCSQGSTMRIASAVVHRGEEPPLVTGSGSGTIFFSGCTLGCSFCQNRQISSGGMGTEVDSGTFRHICLALESAGAGNINLVTGTQYLPDIASGLKDLRREGFGLPVVWNSSGFESAAGLELLEPLMDVYLLDLKVITPDLAERLFGRRDYPEAAMGAALFAADRRPLSAEGTEPFRGTLIRHLVMPGMEEETEKVIRWFGEHLADKALFSLMTQYIDGTGKAETKDPSREERLLTILEEAGIENGFIQEGGDESFWLPDFRRWNPFPEDYADPVWHWKTGFDKPDTDMP